VSTPEMLRPHNRVIRDEFKRVCTIGCCRLVYLLMMKVSPFGRLAFWIASASWGAELSACCILDRPRFFRAVGTLLALGASQMNLIRGRRMVEGSSIHQ